VPDDTPQVQQRGNAADWRPIPDPTTRTTEDLVRALQAERDYVNGQVAILMQRLDGMDRATELLNETVNRVPTDLQSAIAHERELNDEQFKSVQVQFKERDTRAEREARDNKIAVDAAFAAQDKSATKQDEANQKAIDKSEKATIEAINKNADAADARAKGIDAKVDDLKERLVGGEARLIAIEQRTAALNAATVDHRAGASTTAVFVGLVFTAIIGLSGIILGIAAFFHG
jgi:chromosome segregation ATPase